MRDVVSDRRLRFVDLNHDDAARAVVSNFSGLGAVWLPLNFLQADYVVSMPKLKTHHLAGMTGQYEESVWYRSRCGLRWPKNPLHSRYRTVHHRSHRHGPTAPGRTACSGWKATAPSWGRPRHVGRSAWRLIWWRSTRRALASSDSSQRRCLPVGGRRVHGECRCRAHRTTRRAARTLPDPFRRDRCDAEVPRLMLMDESATSCGNR